MKILIILITDGKINPKCYDSLLNQDYKDYSILIHVQKKENLLSNPIHNTVANVADNREKARQMALMSDADLFFFAESDMVYPTNCLTELGMQIRGNIKAIAGYYLKKNAVTRKVGVEYCAARLIEDNRIVYLKNIEPSVTRVDYAGLGCFMLTRYLLSQIPITYNSDQLLNIGDTKAFIDDNFALCDSINELGESIFINGNVICEHIEYENRNI